MSHFGIATWGLPCSSVIIPAVTTDAVRVQANQATKYPAEAKALHAQLREFFSAHQTVRASLADRVALGVEEALRPQTADNSDPYDLL